MGLPELSNILWRERNLLELLQFKLEEEQLVLAAGRTRWLARATHEVELVLEELKTIELSRAVEVDGVAADLGLEPNTSLRALAAAAPPPWGGLLEQHRSAFLVATQEIVTLARLNKDILADGARATEEALAWLVGADATRSTYEPPARRASGRALQPAGPRLLDQAV